MSSSSMATVVVGYDVSGFEFWESVNPEYKCERCQQGASAEARFCQWCGCRVERVCEWKSSQEIRSLAATIGTTPKRIFDPKEPSESDHIYRERLGDDNGARILGIPVIKSGFYDYLRIGETKPIDPQEVADAAETVKVWGRALGLNEEPKLWLLPYLS